MEISKVYDIFYTQKRICFSKGYKVFEEAYEDLKDKLNLKREEIKHVGSTEVIITKGDRNVA